MKRYLIGRLVVDVDATCERLEAQGKAYESDVSGPADITVSLPESQLDDLQNTYPLLSRDDVAYLATGSLFSRYLISFHGLMLHSSCIAMEGRAYLFSADCGTGKSTHTGLWKRFFGDKVTYINDDKPILRLQEDGTFYAYGTPWSGKTPLNTNTSAPLKAIVFLERDIQNTITPMEGKDPQVLRRFLEQTARPKNPLQMEKMLQTADRLLRQTPVFLLKCDMSAEAVRTSYECLKNC